MGEFNYEKEFQRWKWDIPKKYNIGVDLVDKHAQSKNSNKVVLYWENDDGLEKKFTFEPRKKVILDSLQYQTPY